MQRLGVDSDAPPEAEVALLRTAQLGVSDRAAAVAVAFNQGLFIPGKTESP